MARRNGNAGEAGMEREWNQGAEIKNNGCVL